MGGDLDLDQTRRPAGSKAPSAAAPTARSDFALAYDGATGQVVLFGGRCIRVDLGDAVA